MVAALFFCAYLVAALSISVAIGLETTLANGLGALGLFAVVFLLFILFGPIDWEA
jgi:hypothetical protein